MKTSNISNQNKIAALTAELSSKNSEEKNTAILRELALLCGDATKDLPELTDPMKELLNGITKLYLPDFNDDITEPVVIVDSEVPVSSDLQLSNHDCQTLDEAIDEGPQ